MVVLRILLLQKKVEQQLLFMEMPLKVGKLSKLQKNQILVFHNILQHQVEQKVQFVQILKFTLLQVQVLFVYLVQETQEEVLK